MTTKLNFLTGACATFNCTHNVVLAAVSGRHSVHPALAKQIKEAATKGCNATPEEWQAFAKEIADSPIADKIIWALVSGAEIEVGK